mmetsp:Transcript_155364/g.289910  ORF Transcript_155364/g.289910 Transcript_155364/m.289910 type:complete len:500 (-) Transcript_155364:41-1540(-)
MAGPGVAPAASGLPAPPGCQVCAAAPPKTGFGLFSEVSRAPGEQVFADSPLFVIQHTGNRRMVAACANCCAFVEPLHAQLEVLFSEARFGASLLATLAEAAPHWQAEHAAAEAAAGVTVGEAVRCSQGCGEVYCSEACRAAHWGQCHNLLCVGPVQSEDHPLLRFKYHALEHTDALLLAAQVLAHLINRARAMGGGIAVTQGLMAELLSFCHAPFREACRPPPGRGKDAEFVAHTDGLIAEAAGWLKAAFDIHAPAEAAALFQAGPAFLSEVLGLFEYNNIDVEVTSPLAAFFSAKGRTLLARGGVNGPGTTAAELALVERLLREKEWLMRCIWGEETTGIYADDAEIEAAAAADPSAAGAVEVDAAMDEDGEEAVNPEVVNKAMSEARAAVDRMSFEQLLEAQWPAFHGTGLFMSVARINHSCAPNVKVLFPMNSARLQAIALTPVNAGEELCISYIRQEADVKTRRRQLLEYGFNCVCEKCVREDSTSVRKAQKRLK